jgi:predicted metal-binding protein
MPDKPLSRIGTVASGDRIKASIENYCATAREMGADDALPVAADAVPVDERVAVKCRIPKCFGYGTSAHCPPHSLAPEETRKLLSRYRLGVVFRLQVEPGVIVRDRTTIKERVAAYRNVFDIVNRLESDAFYDGYYLSVGFAAGSCKSTFCHDQPCSVLQGEKCRLALRARPSMEAVGIDCYRMAADLGWEIYPVGSAAERSSVPCGNLMGLIMVD